MSDMSYDGLKAIIEKRSSHRKFSDKTVPVEMVARLIDCAHLAPSGHNIQPWKFIAVMNKGLIAKIAEAVDDALKSTASILPEDKRKKLEEYSFFVTHFQQAPVVITVLVSESEYITTGFAREYGVPRPPDEMIDIDLLDAGAAIQNLLLAAQSLGLGSCWMTAPLTYAREKIEELLEVAPGYRAISLISIGWPTKERKPAPKKDVTEVLRIIE